MLLPALTLAGVLTAAPLTLPQLIERARANDHRVKDSEAQLRFLKGKYDEARWAWVPRIETTVMVAGPIPEARNNGVGGPPLTEASYTGDLNLGNMGIMLRAEAQGVLPIYTFGKLDALKELGARGVDLGLALKVRAQDEAEFQVAQAYFGLQLARAANKTLVETAERLAEAEKTVRRLREADSEQVTQMDVYKVEFFARQVKAREGQAASGERLALESLKLLTATDAKDSLEVVDDALREPFGVLPPIEAWLAQAEQQRPEVRAITAGIALREQEVLIRERMYFPDFGIAGFARAVYTSSATPQTDPFANDPYNQLVAGIGLVGRYTWDFPIKAAQLEQARAEHERLLHQRSLLMGGIRLEVAKAHGELADALIRAQHQTEAEKAARRWAQSAFAAFDLGTTDTKETVDSFTALATASGEKAKAWYDVALGLQAARKAVGGPVSLVGTAPEQKPPSPALIPKP